MKNLLYKEFRLAIHPSVYIFFALAGAAACAVVSHIMSAFSI